MRRLARFFDPFIVLLVATVVLAAFLPVTGSAADVVGVTSKVAIGLLFFLYGARLSTQEALEGLRHWRLHLAVVVCTFVVFPLLGLASWGLVPHVLTQELWMGLLFLCIVPSTVQSSIAFTSIARGNVPGAICAATYSSLLGMLLTPLLAALLIGGAVGGFSADSLLDIGTQLLAPFLAGQLLRRWISGFLTRHKSVLQLVDRGAILLVVYTAFSQGVNEGVWQQVSPWRLVGLFGTEAVMLAVMLVLIWYVGRRIGFVRADRVTMLFAGSKKSLAAGLPMAAVLFGADASLAVLPLMLFHQMQLMVCAVIARRLGKKAEREEQAAAAEAKAKEGPEAAEAEEGPGAEDDGPQAPGSAGAGRRSS